ncbi:hypothetical protein RA25_21145 [Leisingera sp. ANG-S5]|nr:hypothetical protein RA21_04145 [Leisingera sp. ANG-DT]KIC28719.1 hypothetical protein RA25_21145 [Leisingera sp. ANG-S5]
MKTSVKNALVKFRPYDAKLRQFAPYKAVSSQLESLYRNSPLSGPAGAKDRIYYYTKYDQVALDSKVVLFDSFWGRKISCNPYAIFLEMHRRDEFKGHTFIWVKNKDVEAPEWMAGRPDIKFVDYRSKEYAHALLQAETLVANSNFPGYFIRKPGQKYINVWHGIPLKCMGMDMPQKLQNSFNTQHNFTQSTHICLASDYAIEKTVVPYGDVFSTGRARVTGSPRVDVTLNADAADVRRRLGLADGKKVILYAPTWRGVVGNVAGEMAHQVETIQLLSEKFGGQYHILLSIHNYTKNNLKSLPQNCHIIPDQVNINEVLAATDILISDYSSVFFDFLVLDRPAVLYTYDLEDYKATRGLYLDINTLPLQVAHTHEQLTSFIAAPAKPSESENYAAVMKDILPQEDGQASRRVVDLVLSQPELECAPSDKKTILFYPGFLGRNGITAAFFNLLETIDHSKYDVSVVVDCRSVDSSPDGEDYFRKLRRHCRVVLKSEAMFVAPSDMAVYNAWRAGETVEGLGASLERSMDLEVRRILSDRHFDCAVNYSAYTVWWVDFIKRVSAGRHAIYQHNDLHAEAHNSSANRDQRQLLNVFEEYKDVQSLISVSPSLRDINAAKLGQYYPGPDSAKYARNIVHPDRILKQAQDIRALPEQIKTLLSFEQLLEQQGLETRPLVKFVTSGRLSPEKNQARLIEAMKQVVEAGINAVLIVMGTGPLEKDLKALARKLDLQNRIIFTGHVDNPFAVISMCECFVLPSDYEGQPMVLLEALAMQKYCIGSDVPSIRYVLEGYGELVERTPDAFAEAMIRSVKTPKDVPAFDFGTYTKEAMAEFHDAIGV